MGIKDYFSTDENKRSSFIFNFIAPLYGRLGHRIADNYTEKINKINKIVNIEGKTVLDLGSGSGSWAVKFYEQKAKKVVGIDSAEKMIKVAKKNYPFIDFILCDAENLRKFEDNSFDIVTASYVLHGVKKDRRLKMIEQMKRVTKKYIIINDFAGKVSFPTQLLEILERSDMMNFKKYFLAELKENFSKANLLKLQKGGGIYIAEK